ncbi:MAG: secretin N-terminal domain-containing protein, partial [Humidesulfovibrio sp.]|nr:secretin N-terminal domain-containing protein [Humidesulfovibrio sp.]
MGRSGAPGHCGLMAAALLCLLVGLGLLAAPEARAGAAALQIGLEGAAFKDFLLFMGQFSGQSPVFREDQLPDATVTLVSRQPVAEADLAEMLGLVLTSAGLSATPREGVLYLLPGPKRPAQATGPTQILVQRLNQGLSPGQVAGVLERLRSDAGQVAAAEQGRWVLIRDRAERVARARVVLAALEAAPAGARLEFAPLRRAEARLAARKLEMHFRGLPGKAPVVLALEWSNTLLLAGDSDQIGQGLRLLAQMDEGGNEAPALRAFRLRYVKAEKVAGVLLGLAASDKRLGNLRVRVDAEAGAVVVLAEPELMARVERLVEDLDQPRPRVLVEALVLELPLQGPGRAAVLAAIPAPGGGAVVLANPPAGSPAGARGFAQASVGMGGLGGAGLSLRGKALEGPQGGLDALAALLAADPEVRVLARPRAAVLDGGEMRVSISQADPTGVGPGVERLRLVFTPVQEAEGGQVSVRVSLEHAQALARLQMAEAHLSEGALLLLIADAEGGELAPAGADKAGSGWTMSSPRQKAQAGPGRIGIVLSARVTQGGPTAAGAGRGLGGT